MDSLANELVKRAKASAAIKGSNAGRYDLVSN